MVVRERAPPIVKTRPSSENRNWFRRELLDVTDIFADRLRCSRFGLLRLRGHTRARHGMEDSMSTGAAAPIKPKQQNTARRPPRRPAPIQKLRPRQHQSHRWPLCASSREPRSPRRPRRRSRLRRPRRQPSRSRRRRSHHNTTDHGGLVDALLLRASAIVRAASKRDACDNQYSDFLHRPCSPFWRD